jgi:hypothetical protein
MLSRQVMRFILLFCILEFAVGDHYCSKDGVYGRTWQQKCDDDDYYCCGVNDERCCDFEEYTKESGLEDVTDVSNQLEMLPSPERFSGKKIVKIIVGVIVTSVILGILLMLCCCCLPCCFFAKRRKRQAGVVRGQNMTEVAYPSQPAQNNQALLQNTNTNYPQHPPPASSYPPGAAAPPYPPANHSAYPQHPGYPPQAGPGGYPDQPPPYSGPSAGYSSGPPEPYQTKQPAFNPNAMP